MDKEERHILRHGVEDAQAYYLLIVMRAKAIDHVGQNSTAKWWFCLLVYVCVCTHKIGEWVRVLSLSCNFGLFPFSKGHVPIITAVVPFRSRIQLPLQSIGRLLLPLTAAGSGLQVSGTSCMSKTNRRWLQFGVVLSLFLLCGQADLCVLGTAVSRAGGQEDQNNRGRHLTGDREVQPLKGRVPNTAISLQTPFTESVTWTVIHARHMSNFTLWSSEEF